MPVRMMQASYNQVITDPGALVHLGSYYRTSAKASARSTTSNAKEVRSTTRGVPRVSTSPTVFE